MNAYERFTGIFFPSSPPTLILCSTLLPTYTPLFMVISALSVLPTSVSVSELLSSTVTAPVSTSSFLSSPSSDRNIPSPSVSHTPSKSGFWSNKVAVGGTFAAIGLVLVGVILFIVFTCIKRRRMMRQPEKGDGQRASSIHVDDPEDWRYTSRLDPFAAPWNVKPMPPPSSSSSIIRGEKSYSDKSVSKLIA